MLEYLGVYFGFYTWLTVRNSKRTQKDVVVEDKAQHQISANSVSVPFRLTANSPPLRRVPADISRWPSSPVSEARRNGRTHEPLPHRPLHSKSHVHASRSRRYNLHFPRIPGSNTSTPAKTDAKYLVPSKSNPSKVYEVDIDAYTCTCLDYPLLCYCKHICAVQELFDEQQPPSSSNGNPQQPLNSLDVPSLSTLSPVANVNAPVQGRKSNVLNVVMDKLDRLGARLRGRGRSAPSLSGRPQELEAAVDALLLETDADSVLPSAQRLPPVVKDRSARQAMMPEVKTRKKPAGDSAYGGGVSSGSKAKKAKLKATSPVLPSTSTPQPRPTAPALINLLLMQLPPQTAFAYYPPHPYPYPHYPQYLVPPQYPPSQSQ
ncbi:hypothetical protein C8R46DRAFT_1358681 [Mycena filopes]|nr:hypothetical protein C8R46DRAFT_1358681 [Mycena filopes]